MKLAKSLLLGSAAGIVAVAGAQAADLPTKKAAPVEYVRVCDAYGAGFFYVPGTRDCLKIGGRVRAEYAWLSSRNMAFVRTGAVAATPANPTGLGLVTPTSSRAQNQSGFRARGRIELDHRTQTSWGTLRTFVRFEVTRNTGIYNGNANGTSNGNGGVNVDKAFIQFAGITAGRALSMFDFYADNFNWGALRDSDTNANLLAYTATFGGGFSATISLEEGVNRFGNLSGVAYAGTRLPDVIANLRVDQGWGSAQLSGALTPRRTVAGNGFGAPSKDYVGWAIQGGVKINLPMLAAGDELWLQAAYAVGALDFIGVGPNSGIMNGGFLARQQGGLLRNDFDAIAVAAPGGYRLEKTKGWSAMAAFQHYWTPSFRSVLFGSYAQVSYGAAGRNSLITGPGTSNANEWRVGLQNIWSPVSGFDIGLEVMYVKLNQRQVLTPGQAAFIAANGGVKKNPDAIEARLRFQRTF